MKKRSFSGLLAAVMLLTGLTACTPAADHTPSPTPAVQTTPEPTLDPTPELTPSPVCNLTVTTGDLPQAQFAGQDILAAAQECGVEEAWNVSVETIDESLGYEAYRVEVNPEELTITVTGGDANGLMYGGLEVAEQIALANGPEGVMNCEGAPYVENRGIKLDIPLDMRTPSYGDTADSAQKNIETMWNMEFWKAELDALARNRYNAITLWNLNPFPSMVEVPEFPDVALDDVWRTTLPFDDTYNLSATNMVRPEHWENYEVVKETTIDEKIAFWQEVMAYAHDRGIRFYIITWNIYTYGENGQYGITPEVDNPITAEYFRASVREMVRTYPDLDGIGVTAGENMEWAPGMETVNEQWLYDTYGLGIADALESEPDREFTLIHRLHLTEFDMVNEIWADFPGKLEYCENYAAAHMYAHVAPKLINDTLTAMPEGDRLWLTIRSDDFYFLHWGDPDFVRQYILNMPERSRLAGYMMGGDGYVPAVEYSDVDSRFFGQMSVDKQWYTYLLWGRLGYDPTIPVERFTAILKEYYSDTLEEDVELLAQAYCAAGKILPQVSCLFFLRGDAAWYPEAGTSHPSSSGYLNIKRWANSENVMEGAGVMSIAEYVKGAVDGGLDYSLRTPPEVSAQVRQYALATLAITDEIGLVEEGSLRQAEFARAVKDQRAMALLGLYYAEKIDGAVELTYYNETGDTAHQSRAIKHLEESLSYWKEYAAAFSSQYMPQRLGRQGYIDVNEITEQVAEDITLAEEWKIRAR